MAVLAAELTLKAGSSKGDAGGGGPSAALRAVVGTVPTGLDVEKAYCALACKQGLRGVTAKVPAIEVQEYTIEDWGKQVPELVRRLNLTSTQELRLLSASEGSTQDSFSSYSRSGKSLITSFTSFHTSLVGSTIRLSLGHLQHRTQLHEVTAQDPKTSVVYAGRTFQALPEASPLSKVRGQDMKDRPQELPPCATPIRTDDANFTGIATSVIAPHGWSADTLLVYNAHGGEWATYNTALLKRPGKLRNPKVRWFHPRGNRFTTIVSSRLLVEVPSLQRDEAALEQEFRHYVEVLARREWAIQLKLASNASTVSRLGMTARSSEL